MLKNIGQSWLEVVEKWRRSCGGIQLNFKALEPDGKSSKLNCNDFFDDAKNINSVSDVIFRDLLKVYCDRHRETDRHRQECYLVVNATEEERENKPTNLIELPDIVWVKSNKIIIFNSLFM